MIGHDAPAPVAGATGVRARLGRLPRVQPAALVALVAGVALLGLLLFEASVHTYAGNSDGATVLLEGQAMSTGHLALKGWAMSLESFWSVDALFYAVAVRVVGLRADLLHVVPMVLAVAFVVAGAWLSRRGRSAAPAVVGAVTTVAIVGLPSPVLAFFLLQGPWHIGTALWCLIAFAALTGKHALRGLAVAAVFIAAALLGDFMTIGIGVIPLAVVGLVTVLRRRRLAPGAWLLAALPASVVIAVLVHLASASIGTFTIVNRNVVLSRSQMLHNLHHLPRRLAALFGVGNLALGVVHQSLVASVAHGLVLAVVAGAVLYGLYDLLRGLVRGDRGRGDARLEDLLLLALFGSVGTYVVTAPAGNLDYLRYLTPAVLFAAVLTARHLGTLVGSVERVELGKFAAVAGAGLTVALFLDASLYLGHEAAPAPVAALDSFLVAHGLNEGIGDYWCSSYVTVETRGAVLVRPVTNTAAGQLLRYDRQSSASWYEGQNFQFFVYDSRHPWREVDTKSAVVTFGQPVHTYSIGTYRVLVWSHDLTLSAAEPPEPDPLRFYFRL